MLCNLSRSRPHRGPHVSGSRVAVVKTGKALTLAQTEVVAVSAGRERLIALLTATLMVIEKRDGVTD
jgi:hypothetical protein